MYQGKLVKVWPSGQLSGERSILPLYTAWGPLCCRPAPLQTAAHGEVERYVQALFDAVSRASAMAFKYEFTLETPLTIHTRWPYLPLEIGLAWHPILNVPYIPASSLKGAARAAAVSPLCGIDRKDLFGTAEEEGDLIFTDAYPTRWERLVEPTPLQRGRKRNL